ncbi:NADH-quinone oxidoreductase subunit NuoG [Buchnera aphidicola (Kurisakia onigurumii)]|uniref:NADH-quinone oxidoreductase subunit NuoG n=1 Tax=Buchnera aphidicola TaxID=9 RepID=UPI0031B6C019
MAKLYIDNKLYIVNESNNLLHTCLSKGINIPYFCWHPELGSVGVCRQCSVKKYSDINDKIGIIVMSCMTPSQDGNIISTKSHEIINFRKDIIELMMNNHPHDCPVCSEGGNCHLQDMTVMTKHYKRRYVFSKKKYKNQYLGPFINHEMNRCISCYRCVRFYKNYAGGKDFNVYGSADNLYFGRFEEGILENEHSGNLIEICPTGVFTDKLYEENYNRKWDMQYSPSICNMCSIGCNISVGERYGEIRKIENRYNIEINNYFLCDVGRFVYDFNNVKNRPNYFSYNKKEICKFLNFTQSIDIAVSYLKKSTKILGIGSSRSSIENNFALLELVGIENFSTGLLQEEHNIITLINQFIKQNNLLVPSLREVEESDAILILGEDIINTAPRLALSVRRAMKKKSKHLNKFYEKKIFYKWQSDTVKIFSKKFKNSLFIINYNDSSLNGLCTLNYSKKDISVMDLIININHLIENNELYDKKINDDINKYINFVVNSLKLSKNPLIISGSHSRSLSIIKLAINISKNLKKNNKNTKLLFVTPDANSMGISCIPGFPLEKAIDILKNNKNVALIIMENDLYRHLPKKKLKYIFNNKTNNIVLDHQFTKSFRNANLKVPVKNFFESSGTLINYEGRLQRFFQVYEPSFYNKNINRIESWRWLHALKCKFHRKELYWLKLDDIISDCSNKILDFKNIISVAPKSSYRIFGQKVPRSPHRFSGRTSFLSNIDIHEPKQPEDIDSMFSFSMEGTQLHNKYSDQVPFYWSPGWNSLQSGNRYQLENNLNVSLNKKNFFIKKNDINIKLDLKFLPDVFLKKNSFKIIPHYFLFDSKEIFQYCKKIDICKKKYGIMNHLDAENLKIKNNSIIYFFIFNNIFTIKIKISHFMQNRYISLPLGSSEYPFCLSGKEIILFKENECGSFIK